MFFCQGDHRQPGAQPGEQLVGNGAALPGHLFSGDVRFPVPANESGHVSGGYLRPFGDVHQQLIHAHPPHHGTASSAQQHLPAPLGEGPGQAVGVTDGYHRQPPVLRGLKGQPVPRSAPGGEGAYGGHPGPEGEHRLQPGHPKRQAGAAGRTVQGDARLGILAGLGRQAAQAVAGLDVERPRVQPPPPQFFRRLVKDLQLPCGKGPVLLGVPVGDTQMGKYPLHLQVGQGEHVGDGGGILRRDAQPVHPGVQSQMDP